MLVNNLFFGTGLWQTVSVLIPICGQAPCIKNCYFNAAFFFSIPKVESGRMPAIYPKVVFFWTVNFSKPYFCLFSVNQNGECVAIGGICVYG